MSIDKIYVFTAAFVTLFCVSTFVIFSTPSLQWPGLDNFVWPTAAVLLGMSSLASLFPAIPYGRRVIGSGSNKVAFAISYAALICYTVIGVMTVLIYYIRAKSGV
jgi:hypothetical protein